jgi:tetratricopeptide (TPR) repeat protein
MAPRSQAPTWILLAALAVLAGAGALVVWRGSEAPPDLGAIGALAREGRFDRAQKLLDRYLRHSPRDDFARLLMAQLAMDRPDPQPERALEHLGRIRPRTPRDAAVVRFSVGKARYQQKRYDLAETFWKEALAIDPTVPEAGWALIDLLDLEGRTEEAHRLGMQLFEVEPDPRDRVRLLLELARLDVDRVAPGSVVQVLEPVWRRHPESLSLALALGLALVHNSQSAQGIAVLGDALRRAPGSAEAWDAWLTGLDESYERDRLGQEFARLPPSLAGDPRFAKHEARVAQVAGDWSRAVAAYRRASALEPFNGVLLYRLRMALRATGETAEVDRVDQWLAVYRNAFLTLRPVYAEAAAIRTLGLEPRPRLYQRLARLREQLGRFDEARAWHRLVLRDLPDDALSRAALARIEPLVSGPAAPAPAPIPRVFPGHGPAAGVE